MNDLYIMHYGVGHDKGGHSGRYPWGSGKNPFGETRGKKKLNRRTAKKILYDRNDKFSTYKIGSSALSGMSLNKNNEYAKAKNNAINKISSKKVNKWIDQVHSGDPKDKYDENGFEMEFEDDRSMGDYWRDAFTKKEYKDKMLKQIKSDKETYSLLKDLAYKRNKNIANEANYYLDKLKDYDVQTFLDKHGSKLLEISNRRILANRIDDTFDSISSKDYSYKNGKIDYTGSITDDDILKMLYDLESPHFP